MEGFPNPNLEQFLTDIGPRNASLIRTLRLHYASARKGRTQINFDTMPSGLQDLSITIDGTVSEEEMGKLRTFVTQRQVKLDLEWENKCNHYPEWPCNTCPFRTLLRNTVAAINEQSWTEEDDMKARLAYLWHDFGCDLSCTRWEKITELEYQDLFSDEEEDEEDDVEGEEDEGAVNRENRGDESAVSTEAKEDKEDENTEDDEDKVEVICQYTWA